MEEEISLRSTTSPLTNDYEKKDVSDYTLGHSPGDGPDSVQPVSYRSVGDHASIDHISGLVPTTVTTTSYVNGGPANNLRPKHAEPIEDGGLHGVGDVDFDDKFTDAYANLDDVRDRHYHLARGARSPSPTERPIYRGVPNHHHPKEQKRRFFFLAWFVAILFVFEFFLLAIGIFNLVNGLEVGTLTKRIVSSPSSTASAAQLSTLELSVAVEQLRQQMNDIKNNLTVYNNTHSTSLDNISAQILALSTAVNNLTASTTAEASPKSVDIPLHEGCEMTINRCSTSLVPTPTITSLPNFAACVTGPYVHTESLTYLANILCAVTDESQITPISSTLTYDQSTKSWTCRCQAIILPNEFFTSLENFECQLRATKCPKIIHIPWQ